MDKYLSIIIKKSGYLMVMYDVIWNILGIITLLIFDIILIEICIVFGAIIYGDYFEKDEIEIGWDK